MRFILTITIQVVISRKERLRREDAEKIKLNKKKLKNIDHKRRYS